LASRADEGVSLENHLAAYHRLLDGDVFGGEWVNLQDILTEHHEVHQLAYLDKAFLFFLESA
jgi:hypothetical protein